MMATKKATRKTKKKAAKKRRRSSVAARQRPNATKAAARQLVVEIEARENAEKEALVKLETGAESDPVRVARCLVDLSENNRILGIRTEQLRALTTSVTDAQARQEFERVLARRAQDTGQGQVPALRRRIEVKVTDALVSRPRARRGAGPAAPRPRENHSPPAGPPPDDQAGTNLRPPPRIEHHDVLVIAPTGVHSREQFYRFPVIKEPLPTGAADPEQLGQYRDPPELLDAFDYGQRRALAVARPQDWGPVSVRATQRGPAFSTLPLKPEPNSVAAGASDSSQCYLINAQNLNYRNAWTAEEWNDTPGGIDLPPAPSANHNELETLLAGPQGKVFRLEITSIADWEPGTRGRIVASTRNGERELGTVESINLRPHMEIWHQLRGGTAMGRVYFNDASGPRVVPLVNITTLSLE